MKSNLLIDDLLEDYLPKRYYGHEARKNAKRLALKFFELARQQLAMDNQMNVELFYNRKLTKEERDRILQKWGYTPKP